MLLFNETTNLKLTLAIQWRSSKITVRDVNGSREVAEVSEGVNVSLRAGGVERRLAQLSLVPFLQRNIKTKGLCLVSRREGSKKTKTEKMFYPCEFKSGNKETLFARTLFQSHPKKI